MMPPAGNWVNFRFSKLEEFTIPTAVFCSDLQYTRQRKCGILLLYKVAQIAKGVNFHGQQQNTIEYSAGGMGCLVEAATQNLQVTASPPIRPAMLFRFLT